MAAPWSRRGAVLGRVDVLDPRVVLWGFCAVRVLMWLLAPGSFEPRLWWRLVPLALAALTYRYPLVCGLGTALVTAAMELAQAHGVPVGWEICLGPVACLVILRRRALAMVTVILSMTTVGFEILGIAPWLGGRGEILRRVIGEYGRWLPLFLFAWVIGELVARARQTRSDATAKALADQRRGIAADVHDLVAHDLALISMLAEHARLQPDESAQDVQRILLTSRRANARLRSMIGLLREDAPQLSPTGRDSLAAVLDEGVSRLQRSGWLVNIATDSDLADLPAPVSDAAAKIVREALNNATRHAGAHELTVAIDRSPSTLTVAVSNPLLGHPSTGTFGFGLTGMTERARALGGRLTAGPNGSTWIVRTDLPTDQVLRQDS